MIKVIKVIMVLRVITLGRSTLLMIILRFFMRLGACSTDWVVALDDRVAA